MFEREDGEEGEVCCAVSLLLGTVIGPYFLVLEVVLEGWLFAPLLPFLPNCLSSFLLLWLTHPRLAHPRQEEEELGGCKMTDTVG